MKRKKAVEAVNIRRMVAGDAEEVAAIEAATFSVPWTVSGFKTALERRDTIFFVAEREKRIIGYAGFYISMDEADITNVAVAAGERKKGIGEMLMQAVIDTCKSKDVHMIGLEVRAGNEPAKQLYRKLGFKEVGLRKGFYEKPAEDACVMIRSGEDD